MGSRWPASLCALVIGQFPHECPVRVQDPGDVEGGISRWQVARILWGGVFRGEFGNEPWVSCGSADVLGATMDDDNVLGTLKVEGYAGIPRQISRFDSSLLAVEVEATVNDGAPNRCNVR